MTTKRAAAIVCLLPLAACSRTITVTTPAAGVMVTFHIEEADGSSAFVPDLLDVQVTSGGGDRSFAVPDGGAFHFSGPDGGSLPLADEQPLTLFIASNGDPSASVAISASVWQGTMALGRVDQQVSDIPTDRVGYLDITFGSLCRNFVELDGGNGCPTGMTCDPSSPQCVPDDVKGSTLPGAPAVQSSGESSSSSGSVDAAPEVSSGMVTTGLPGGSAGAESGAPAMSGAEIASESGVPEPADASIPNCHVGSNRSQPNAGVSLSAGCCSTSQWTGLTGQWVSQPSGCNNVGDDGGLAPYGNSQCQVIPSGGVATVPPDLGGAEYRGWWVYVPSGYDPRHPYKVIFQGAGCSSDFFSTGEDGFPFASVDDGQAIQVGLDNDTFSLTPGCLDSTNPKSNDFSFFPWLQEHIEQQFCVDMNHEFLESYGEGDSLMEQIDCAYPDRLRGVASVAGCEPIPGITGTLPTCESAHTAAFFVHDHQDMETPYDCITAACSRMLMQNACTTTDCTTIDNLNSVPYIVPDGGVTLPPGASCRQFKCPTEYPVVFCQTFNQGHSDGQNWGTVDLFWDWMSTPGRLGETP